MIMLECMLQDFCHDFTAHPPNTHTHTHTHTYICVHTHSFYVAFFLIKMRVYSIFHLQFATKYITQRFLFPSVIILLAYYSETVLLRNWGTLFSPPLPYKFAMRINHTLNSTQGFFFKKMVPKVLRWPLMYYFTGRHYTD